jgi:diguanylate cyclase (GGDEF)-like protein
VSDVIAPYLDLLTGAWQREHFERSLALAVRRARAEHTALALLWFDVDDLQEHNDLHGRDTLDCALSWLAQQISLTLDGAGPIGRVSGDEFAAFLPGVRPDRALRFSEQIRKRVPRTLHSSAFGDYRLTLSVGLASLRKAEPWGNLLDAAEEACRRAKVGGRDLVVAR